MLLPINVALLWVVGRKTAAVVVVTLPSFTGWRHFLVPSFDVFPSAVESYGKTLLSFFARD
jgi:hypothetical protein